MDQNEPQMLKAENKRTENASKMDSKGTKNGQNAQKFPVLWLDSNLRVSGFFVCCSLLKYGSNSQFRC